jgi:hypothetical protein
MLEAQARPPGVQGRRSCLQCTTTRNITPGTLERAHQVLTKSLLDTGTASLDKLRIDSDMCHLDCRSRLELPQKNAQRAPGCDIRNELEKLPPADQHIVEVDGGGEKI